MVTLQIDATHAPAGGGASLMQEDAIVGTVTSGDWGHRIGMNLAYAFVNPALSGEGSTMEVDLCGDRIADKVIAAFPYDPGYALMRG